MDAGVALIMAPNLKMSTFLPVARKILGYSPAKVADNASLDDLAHQLVTLAAFKDANIKPNVGSASHQLNLLHVGFLVANDERDTVEIIERASMPFVTTQTVSRGVDAVILCGSLAQWRDAVKRGCTAGATKEVRYVFNSIHRILCKCGLRDIFTDLQATNMPDQTFLLEDKRK